MKKRRLKANPNPIAANIEDGANCSTLALSISNSLLYRKCSTERAFGWVRKLVGKKGNGVRVEWASRMERVGWRGRQRESNRRNETEGMKHQPVQQRQLKWWTAC